MTLRTDLGIPDGQKIPLSKVKEAAKRNDRVGERARLALKLRSMQRV